MFEKQKNCMKFFFSIYLSVLALPVTIKAQEADKFIFDPMSEWEQVEGTNAFIATGKHTLSQNAYVWLFLRDRFDHYYLQNPAVELFDDGTWEATNVVIGKDVNRIVAVMVDGNGHTQLSNMARKMEAEQNWPAIERNTVESLSGYQSLYSMRVRFQQKQNETRLMQEPSKANVPTEKRNRKDTTPDKQSAQINEKPKTDNTILIADFESGSDPIKTGGAIQQWDHGKSVLIETGYHELQGDQAHGKYAAFVRLKYPQKSDEEWSGGGLVLVLAGDEAGLNVKELTTLQLDVKMLPGSILENTKIKLEDSKGNNRAERPLSEFGITLSTEWQTVKIPLEVFTKMRNTDSEDWRGLDRTSVTKLVTVSVRNAEHPNTAGTLLIDNVRFVRYSK